MSIVVAAAATIPVSSSSMENTPPTPAKVATEKIDELPPCKKGRYVAWTMNSLRPVLPVENLVVQQREEHAMKGDWTVVLGEYRLTLACSNELVAHYELLQECHLNNKSVLLETS